MFPSNLNQSRKSFLKLLAGGLLLAGSPPLLSQISPGSVAGHAKVFRDQLIEKILPYWLETSVDKTHGGYVMADDLKGRGESKEKQLVSQTRMIWTFAHAHNKGLSRPGRDYLAAARQGHQFLQDRFQDRRNGGYYWKTDREGNVLRDIKLLYGQSFAVYALVEYARASGDPAPKKQALELYQIIQRRAHDLKNKGWMEHFEADWRPLPPDDPRNEVELVGMKSANSHLHWMEALAELYDLTRDPMVRVSLEECLRINKEQFYPLDPAKSAFHRHPDWREVAGARSAGLSYGHNVEFAWLMVRAEQVLGLEPSWKHFYAHIDHALAYGWDHQRGGLYNKGEGNKPATDTDKVWWAQAEMMAALADSIRHKENPAHEKALIKLCEFLQKHQVNPADGIWLDTVAADGSPKRTGKAHLWKAAYHDGRAIVKFAESFAPFK